MEIGRALDRINSQDNTKHKLFVYSNNYMGFSDKCKDIKSIHYMGFVKGDDFVSAMMQSDILIHTESFLPCNIEQTRLSLSTKIADSVNSGKCILAYGPAEIASMRHLQENKCAHIVTNPADLEKELKILVEDDELRNEYIVNARYCAERYHDTVKNSNRLKKLFYEVLAENVTTI